MFEVTAVLIRCTKSPEFVREVKAIVAVVTYETVVDAGARVALIPGQLGTRQAWGGTKVLLNIFLGKIKNSVFSHPGRD